jgi:putative aldouronate transport system permease protein
VDGAGRLRRILHVDIPGIMPTAVIILVLAVGNIMAIGFEKAFLLQNPLNLSKSEIIATYVYKTGLLNADFSMATAIGLFNSVINLVLLFGVNAIAKRITGNGLWS